MMDPIINSQIALYVANHPVAGVVAAIVTLALLATLAFERIRLDP